MLRLLCIRHAESTHNAAGLWQGQADPALSERGRAQARRLAARLRGAGLTAIASSDLARARETAELLAEPLGLAPVLFPALRERDVGAWSGRSHAEIARRWPDDYARFRAGDRSLRPGGGEADDALAARVRGALDALRARWPEGRLAVVTHLGVLRCWIPELQLENAGTLWLDPDALGGPPPSRAARRAGPL